MAPSIVARTAEIDRLVEGLIDQRFFGPVAVTTALNGARGLGKTSLARAVVADSRLQEVYPDGVVWARLGESLTPLELVSCIEQVVYQLTGQHAMLVDVPSAAQRLAELLDSRCVLLVLDDADDA